MSLEQFISCPEMSAVLFSFNFASKALFMYLFIFICQCYGVTFYLFIEIFGHATCQCCDLLFTMLQMGTAAVSSAPADPQSASSQSTFPNTPQVRSQREL